MITIQLANDYITIWWQCNVFEYIIIQQKKCNLVDEFMKYFRIRIYR